MKHLPTTDFLRDLARRVDADYDRARLEEIAAVIDRAATLAEADHALPPAPGSTSNDAGATITHRPDIAYRDRLGGRPPEHDMSEAAHQAAMQGDAIPGGYLPARQVPVTGAGVIVNPQHHTIVNGNGGTVQAPVADLPAEAATIGVETR